MAKKRIYAYDVLRIMAALAVVMVMWRHPTSKLHPLAVGIFCGEPFLAPPPEWAYSCL